MRKLKTHEIVRKTLAQFHAAEKFPIAVVLDNVRSLLNVGSIFRTSDAFLVGHMHLCGLTGVPPHREIEKSALGSTESVAWTYSDNTVLTLENLRSEGFRLVAFEQTTQSVQLQDFMLDERPVALVFGNEVKGVSQEVLRTVDLAVEIPQFGTKHSLNIAVAAGIALYQVAQQYSDKLKTNN